MLNFLSFFHIKQFEINRLWKKFLKLEMDVRLQLNYLRAMHFENILVFIKNNLSFLLELYYSKKLLNFKSKDKIYYLYKYFLLKINDCNKYNLDIENVLLEFNGKLLNE